MTKNISKLHYDVLDLERQNVWLELKDFKKEGTLAGGTALAMQINHRLSYDFDIFFSKPISKRFLNKVNKIFAAKNIRPLINNEDELTVLYKNKIKISFVCFPFKKNFKKIKTNSLDLFDYRDLAAYKAYAIGRRGTYRDYIDIYFLLKNKISLKHIVSNSKKIFGNNFNEKLFLEQLVYFNDLKDFKIEFISKINNKLTPQIVRVFFEKEIEKYFKI